MSYDVQVWSVKRPDFEDSLSQMSKWRCNGDFWSFTNTKWQVVVGTQDSVLLEDIPQEISASIPGISFLTELNLEPISAPDAAKQLLLRTASTLAKASHGIVYDCQTDEIITPRGVRRFSRRAREERFSILEMGWWFLDDTIFTPDGLSGLLDICEKLLPEALPRRYGLYEPPQHLLAVQGREHLASFLLENLDESPVLYPTRPIIGMSVACNRDHSHPRLGFRSNHLSVECEASAIGQSGWQEGLRRFWLAISQHLGSFYSEVRTLNGFLPMGATYGSDFESEVEPIRSWFWRGVPRELGHAVAIGEPYVHLWPGAIAEGTRHGDLVVLDSGQWIAGSNLTTVVPDPISQRWTPKWVREGTSYSVNWVDAYPEIWPFA